MHPIGSTQFSNAIYLQEEVNLCNPACTTTHKKPVFCKVHCNCCQAKVKEKGAQQCSWGELVELWNREWCTVSATDKQFSLVPKTPPKVWCHRPENLGFTSEFLYRWRCKSECGSERIQHFGVSQASSQNYGLVRLSYRWYSEYNLQLYSASVHTVLWYYEEAHFSTSPFP